MKGCVGLVLVSRLRGDCLLRCVSSTDWSKESVRSYETTATTIPEREKKRARMERTGESRERQRLPDILSITIIGFST